MNHSEIKKLKQVSWIAAGSFFGSVPCFPLTLLFSPIPDFTQDPPTIPQTMLTLGQIGTAFLILGCVALGIKLADEKKIIHSIGFTMMSVAQGVIFVLYLISYNGHEKLEEAYRIFSASLYLLIPSMILIAIYSEFPLWLRLLGLAGCIPYIVENITFSVTGSFNQTIMTIDGIGNILMNLTVLCWGIFVLRNMKKELKKFSAD